MKTELPSPKCMRCTEPLPPPATPVDPSGPKKRARDPPDGRERSLSLSRTPSTTPSLRSPTSTDASLSPGSAAPAAAGGDRRAKQPKLEHEPEGDAAVEHDTGLGYVQSFVWRRLSRGADLRAVLKEFRVPDELWPALPSPSTDHPPTHDDPAVTATAEAITLWLQDYLTTAEAEADGLCPSTRPLVDGDTATVELRPYDGSRPLRALKTRPDAERWDRKAAGFKVTLNAELDASAVPVSSGGTRPDVSHVVVLDNLFGERENAELLRLIVGPNWDDKDGPCPDLWERGTCDAEGLPPSWGVKNALLTKLLDSDCEAIVEVQTRLQQLYPEYDIAHVDESTLGAGVGAGPHVVNAAVHGGDYRWHIDADPRMLDGFAYPNREAGKPYFVTMLLYINDGWPRSWDGETLFLDLESDTGIFVRPAQFRAVLMDQDITHRMSSPSKLAGGKPRYSIVWKLLFVPKDASHACSIARPEWGAPVRLSPPKAE